MHNVISICFYKYLITIILINIIFFDIISFSNARDKSDVHFKIKKERQKTEEELVMDALIKEPEALIIKKHKGQVNPSTTRLYPEKDPRYFEFVLFAVNQSNFFLIRGNKSHLLPPTFAKLFQWRDTDIVEDVDALYDRGNDIQSYQPSQDSISAMPIPLVMLEVMDFFCNLMQGSPPLVQSVQFLTNNTDVFNGAIAPIGTSSKFAFTSRTIRGDIIIIQDISKPIDITNINTKIIRNPLYYYKESKAVSEEDYRLIPLPNNNILITFTAVTDYQYMGFKILNTQQMSRNQYILTDISLITSRLLRIGERKTKNWGAFIYGNDILFVDRIQPLQVIQMEKETFYNDTDLLNIPVNYVNVISKVDCQEVESMLQYGDLRGGTPAIHIRGRYLAFYHTTSSKFITKGLKCRIPTNMEYAFGAYTFSDSIPFYLTALSPHPITTPLIRINGTTNYALEYHIIRYKGMVSFPMSYYLEDSVTKRAIVQGDKELHPKNTTVVLTVGMHDRNTYILRMNLNHLLETLTPVHCNPILMQ